MKISNETKVGALTAIAITAMVLGVNFLKGKSLFDKSTIIYATFPSVEGLATSTPVLVNGLQVGTVADYEEKDKEINGILVSINLAKDVLLPKNSVATINTSLLGITQLVIKKGDSKEFLSDGDTLFTKVSVGLLDEMTGKVSPTLEKVNGAVNSLDSLLEVVGSTLDPKTRVHLQQTLANLDATSAELTKMMDSKNGKLAASLNNVESITGNLKSKNDTINHILGNVSSFTDSLAAMNLKQTVSSLQATVNNLNKTLALIQSGEGTLGKLVTDDQLYEELRSTNYKIQILLDDFRSHPKRYVNVSVFGKKDKSSSLTAPLIDDSVKHKADSSRN